MRIVLRIAGDWNDTMTTRRKGARRISEIPPRILKDLGAGRIETVNLVEWLAIDMEVLVRSALLSIDADDVVREVSQAALDAAELGVTARIKRIGAALHDAHAGRRDRDARFEALATHRSDMVRSFAAYMITADAKLSLAKRLAVAKRFAADGAMSVRECAWDSFREALIADLDRGLELLEKWTRHEDEGVRRCASEATRPRGVWCRHIEVLKVDPDGGLPILEALRADPSRYVQRSVANWINDASKTRADWVEGLAKRWRKESPRPETEWILHHATRTLRKKTR